MLADVPAGIDALHVVTGLVPVIPIREALCFFLSGWPGKADHDEEDP
jgi:hypothetical protein